MTHLYQKPAWKHSWEIVILTKLTHFRTTFFFFQCLFIGSLLGGLFGDPHPYLEDGQFVPLPGCSGTVKQDCEGFLLFFVQTLLCRVSVGGFQLWLLWENGLNHE